jgi:hypothetical protein
MKNTAIKLAYRMKIDRNASSKWEQYVWESTYQEFLMQVQLFNTPESPILSFRELLLHNPKAEQLHYLVGIAAHAYVLQWKGIVYASPDQLGRFTLPFEQYRMELLNSHIQDRNQHHIALTFTSPWLTLLDVIDGHYLVSAAEPANIAEGVETLMFKMQPNLAIAAYRSR